MQALSGVSEPDPEAVLARVILLRRASWPKLKRASRRQQPEVKTLKLN
jgi:hypothetical protein